MGINFFYEVDNSGTIVDAVVVKALIRNLIQKERKELGEINITFTSNPGILEINRKFLNHSYYTDVITFNNCVKNVISGDIIISIEQVKINAKRYNTSHENEIKRVIIHGVLHLVGYDDSTEDEIRVMRKKEDTYLCES